MTQIGKEAKMLGGGNASTSNGHDEDQSTSRNTPPSWKMPWRLFHLLKFIIEISPRLGREISLMLEDLMLSVIHLWGIFKKILKWGIWISLAAMVYIIFSFTESLVDVKIPWYMMYGPAGLALVILVLVLLFGPKQNQTTTEDGTETESESKVPEIGWWQKQKNRASAVAKMWTNGKLVPILACFALIHLSIFMLAPKFWVSQAWGDWSRCLWFWVIQIAIGIAAAVKPEDKTKPTKYKFSTVAVLLLAITFVIHLTGWNLEDKIISLTEGDGTAQAATSRQSTYVRSTDFFIPVGTPECFKEKLGPDKDAAFAAFPGQMDLLAVFCRESRFYHFEPGSTTVPLKNKNSSALGIAQIIDAHDTELTKLGLDKRKLEDSLKYAGILYTNHGLQDWTPKIGEKLVFEVEVSDEWSNTFKMPQINPSERPFNYGLKWSEGPSLIVAIDDESRIVTIRDGENLGYPKNYKFKSGVPGKKVLVTVTYQY